MKEEIINTTISLDVDDIKFKYIRPRDEHGNVMHKGGNTFGILPELTTGHFLVAFAQCSPKDTFDKKFAKDLVTYRFEEQEFIELPLNRILMFMYEFKRKYFYGCSLSNIDMHIEHMTTDDVNLDVVLDYIDFCWSLYKNGEVPLEHMYNPYFYLLGEEQ